MPSSADPSLQLATPGDKATVTRFLSSLNICPNIKELRMGGPQEDSQFLNQLNLIFSFIAKSKKHFNSLQILDLGYSDSHNFEKEVSERFKGFKNFGCLMQLEKLLVNGNYVK